MREHREINCPICPTQICELDGTENVVYLVLSEGKHLPVWDSPMVFSTEEKAYEAIGENILEDIDNGRYSDEEDVEKRLKAAIEAREWGRMEEIHNAYWLDYANPDIFSVIKCPVE